MSPRDELRLVAWTLIGIQLLTAFGAIALLGRIVPAVARIVAENIDSIESAEDMLAALIDAGVPEADRRAAFRDAFDRARDNITEEAERPALNRIADFDDAALSGDPSAVVVVTRSIREITAVNQQAIARAEAEARRLSFAGSWAAAILALVGYFAARGASRRLRRRVVEPIEHLGEVLREARAGDRFRRCSSSRAAPEIQDILRSVNDLLDRGRPTP